MFAEKGLTRDSMPNPAIPVRKTFFMPAASASFPKGRLIAATAMVYVLTTQLTVAALTWK